ncbi:serine hydrolase-like protein [Achroia grisella]|uniref:serine hydrolase-like protein n=1 Tax=Achroia grisella TaxID=688607 RepID=UPI0027D3450E|nr:serine hydrolase-like protein [Achroia grisella]XP_059054686.1 serine hydrolase-like protein [Achroia grisella]
MTTKETKEWFVEMPWGNVAMISWGDSTKPPILMVHGYLDTAATFIPLVELLPDNYYYVSFDFPGHGKSDHVSVAPLATQTLFTEVLRRVVEHMRWKNFIYMAHSMGFINGIYYHHIFPKKIKRMIIIDPVVPVGNQFYVNYAVGAWFKTNYEEHYDSYHKQINDPKLYTYEQAVTAMMNARNLTRAQTKLLLNRCLVPVEFGVHRMTFQPAMRRVFGTWLPEYTLNHVITSKPPPTLVINATENKLTPAMVLLAKKLMKTYAESTTIHHNVLVEGKHDVHITNPEQLVPHIIDFLNDTVKSKL